MVGGGPLRLRCARYAQAPLPRGEASRQAASSHSGAAASFSLCGYQKRPLALPLGELAAVRPSERGLSAKLTEKGLQPHPQAKPPPSVEGAALSAFAAPATLRHLSQGER